RATAHRPVRGGGFFGGRARQAARPVKERRSGSSSPGRLLGPAPPRSVLPVRVPRLGPPRDRPRAPAGRLTVRGATPRPPGPAARAGPRPAPAAPGSARRPAAPRAPGAPREMPAPRRGADVPAGSRAPPPLGGAAPAPAPSSRSPRTTGRAAASSSPRAPPGSPAAR